MKILMISCSENAYFLARRVESILLENNDGYQICQKVKCKALYDISIKESVSELVDGCFHKVDAMIFFSAIGIATRCIAPKLQHKSVDPAVLVVDELGKFCVPILSGHMGGANKLAREIADIIGATPVITTGTDVEGKFSVDDFAREHNLVIQDWRKAKEISANILHGQRVYLERFGEIFEDVCTSISRLEDLMLQEAKEDIDVGYTDRPALYLNNKSADPIVDKIHISYRDSKSHHVDTLCLIPKFLVLGIGCKKGMKADQIREAVDACMMEYHIYPEAIGRIASIDLKKEEPGLVKYCEMKKCPLLTFSADVLKEVEGEFSQSDFVQHVTGVSNVCERSAVAACNRGNGRLIVRKYAYHGVAIAIAVDDIMAL